MPHAHNPGMPEVSTDTAANTPSSTCAATSQHDGRHSNLPPQASIGCRKVADALDEQVECGIVGVFEAHEPAPEPIVLAVQQL